MKKRAKKKEPKTCPTCGSPDVDSVAELAQRRIEWYSSLYVRECKMNSEILAIDLRLWSVVKDVVKEMSLHVRRDRLIEKWMLRLIRAVDERTNQMKCSARRYNDSLDKSKMPW
jgi:hypothetical protein